MLPFPPRFSDLLSLVPVEVKQDRYCQQLLASLEELANFMYTVGPRRMSRKRLITVLGSLRPWELRNPEIAAAVQVSVRMAVLYIDPLQTMM